MTCFRACWLFLLHWVCLCPMLFSFVSDSTCLLFTCLAIDCLLLRAETASLRLSKELYWGFPGGSVVNNLPASAGDAGDMGLIPGLERSPGEKHGNPLQYSCLENPVDRRAWRATVHRVTKIRHEWAHSTHTGSSAAVPSTQEVSQEAGLSVQYGLEHVCMRALSGWRDGMWLWLQGLFLIFSLIRSISFVCFGLVFSWWEIDFIEALYIKHVLSLCHQCFHSVFAFDGLKLWLLKCKCLLLENPACIIIMPCKYI